jgi:hypothetical protein
LPRASWWRSGWPAKQGFAGDMGDATEDEEDVQAALQMASLMRTVALSQRADRRVRGASSSSRLPPTDGNSGVILPLGGLPEGA